MLEELPLRTAGLAIFAALPSFARTPPRAGAASALRALVADPRSLWIVTGASKGGKL